MGLMQPQSIQSQNIYARTLWWISMLGFLFLAVGFMVYLFVPLPHILSAELIAENWHRSSEEFNQSLNVTSGWNWIYELDHGDILSYASIVFLALGTPICLMILSIAYYREGNLIYCIITLAQTIVLIVAMLSTGPQPHS